MVLNPGNHLDLNNKSLRYLSNTCALLCGRSSWIIKPTKFHNFTFYGEPMYMYIYIYDENRCCCPNMRDSPAGDLNIFEH